MKTTALLKELQAFLFRFDVNQVSFRLQGMYSERRKFTKNAFRELIAIEPLICTSQGDSARWR